jgi:hypothetical protein
MTQPMPVVTLEGAGTAIAPEEPLLTEAADIARYREAAQVYYSTLGYIYERNKSLSQDEISYHIVEALDHLHPETASHSRRVGYLSARLAASLNVAAPLSEAYSHDSGKAQGAQAEGNEMMGAFYWRVIRVPGQVLKGDNYADAKAHVFYKHCVEGALIQGIVRSAATHTQMIDHQLVTLFHHYVKDGYPTLEQIQSSPLAGNRDVFLVQKMLDRIKQDRMLSIDQFNRRYLDNPENSDHDRVLWETVLKILIVSASDVADGIIGNRVFNNGITDTDKRAIAKKVLQENFPGFISVRMVEIIDTVGDFVDYQTASDLQYASWYREAYARLSRAR